jgi:hypothetical protein
VRTNRSNAVYRGPTVDIGDAWVERQRTTTPAGVPVIVVWMDWQPSDEELLALRSGGLVRLGIWGMEPIPPVSLDVRADLEVIDPEPPVIHEAEV